MIPERLVVSAAIATKIKPASNASPPVPVTSSAWSAAFRAPGFSWSKPTKKNDATLVSSQKTNNTIASSAITAPAIAVMNSSSMAVRRRKRASPSR